MTHAGHLIKAKKEKNKRKSNESPKEYPILIQIISKNLFAALACFNKNFLFTRLHKILREQSEKKKKSFFFLLLDFSFILNYIKIYSFL